MADGQEQTPHIGTGEPSPHTETAGGQSRPEHGSEDAGPAAHWCYQCNKEVVVEPEQGGGPGSMVCTECQSGFVEALATAQTVPDVRRAQRRRRHRRVVAGVSPATAAARQMVPLSEALEHLYPQQLMQVLQMLGQATNRSNSPATGPQETENAGNGRARNDMESQIPPTSQDSAVTASQASVEALAQASGDLQAEAQDGRVETTAGEDTPAATAEALERLAQEGHMLFISGASPGHEEDADEDLVISDTESEEGMRLEFDAWDSADDDEEEWEEVDEDEEAAATGGEEAATTEEHEAEPREGEQAEQQQVDERQPRVRDFRLRTRNMEHNLHQYLQELLHNLVGQNVEVRVELPNGPLYVGNPGDYVDARGFEQLLQQMAENDNSRRGAPPAAKTAVDCLPSISIEQRHLDDGSAVCAICKDVVALGEPAKQLPCLHLYHNDCILPWLNSRNSCPVCRYELPTDDPDYEEQKQNRNGPVPSNTSQSPDSGTEAVGAQENNNSGENAVQNSPGQHQAARSVGLVSEEMLGASTSGSESQQFLSTVGEQEPIDSTSDCSLLEGLGNANTNSPQSSDEGRDCARGENESDEVGREALRGTGRGWFLLAAAPVLSMMGLVLVLCLGNHFIGGGMHHLGTPLQSQQQRFFQEPHVEQISGASEVQGRRRWWMPFQR
ncbi:unnamed protein product [Calypogeia fissa]